MSPARLDREALVPHGDVDCGCRLAVDSTSAIASLSGAHVLQTIADGIDSMLATAAGSEALGRDPPVIAGTLDLETVEGPLIMQNAAPDKGCAGKLRTYQWPPLSVR